MNFSCYSGSDFCVEWVFPLCGHDFNLAWFFSPDFQLPWLPTPKTSRPQKHLLSYVSTYIFRSELLGKEGKEEKGERSKKGEEEKQQGRKMKGCLVGEAAFVFWWEWLPPGCELTKDWINV